MKKILIFVLLLLTMGNLFAYPTEYEILMADERTLITMTNSIQEEVKRDMEERVAYYELMRRKGTSIDSNDWIRYSTLLEKEAKGWMLLALAYSRFLGLGRF